MTDHTTDPNQRAQSAKDKPSALSFDPASLTQGVRVRPADFARMCQVSRQTVSQWVKRGVILLYPDGRLDPVEAAKRVISHTDPRRMRARIFKDAMMGLDDWRRRAESAEAALAEARARVEWLDRYLDRFAAEAGLAEELFHEAIAVAVDALHSAPPESRRALIEELADDATIRAGKHLGHIGEESADITESEFAAAIREIDALIAADLAAADFADDEVEAG